MEYGKFITHRIDMYMGKPKSGKTLIAGSYPKPLLYISVGDDGGGRVLYMNYRKDCEDGNIKVINLTNDPIVDNRIKETSIEKLAKVLAELRKPDADKFQTIVIDTVGALQDDYVAYLTFCKGGKHLSMQEYGDVANMMLNIKDNMKRFSKENDCNIVWCFHTKEMEAYETNSVDKEIRTIPDLTQNNGVKFMRDASNIFYCCRKTVEDNGEKKVKFLVYAGPHPLMDTGSRDVVLKEGGYIEDFSYGKWQEFVAQNHPEIRQLNVVVPEIEEDNEEEN